MSPSPEPVAPSPEEKIRQAFYDVWDLAVEIMGDDEYVGAAPMTLGLPILTRLYLAAKIEVLEAVAADDCPRCASGGPAIAKGSDWCHPVVGHPDYEFVYCEGTPAVHDTLAKLREEAK